MRMAVRMGAFAIGSALTLDAQQEPPSFRSEATYVEIDARVTDRDGALVKDLTKEDFELLEDGQPQAIADFRFIDLPIEPPRRDVPVLESDVVTNGTNRRVLCQPLSRLFATTAATTCSATMPLATGVTDASTRLPFGSRGPV